MDGPSTTYPTPVIKHSAGSARKVMVTALPGITVVKQIKYYIKDYIQSGWHFMIVIS